MASFDDTIENADWLKQSWDLPPYKSAEFLSIFSDLEKFRTLPVYTYAVAHGLIRNDQWVGSYGKMLKRKVRPRGRALLPVSKDRPAVRTHIRRLKSVILSFFDKAKRTLIYQTVAATNKHVKKLSKAVDDYTDIVDGIMSQIDFSVFNTLPQKVQAILESQYAESGSEGLQHVGVAVAASKAAPELDGNAFNQVSKTAVEYAKTRSAEMVGMKYVDGKLVPNPDAKWQISDPTREGIRSRVEDVIAGRLPSTELADTLRTAYDFSPERAEMIARTEIHAANGAGALSGYQSSGVVELKVWLTSGDEDVSEECGDNEDEGPIPIDDDFSSGDEADPAHPNCRCSIAPYVEWEADDGTATDDGESDGPDA